MTEDSMNKNELLAFDPDYWEERAAQLRLQAQGLHNQPLFCGILLKHAEDLDRLARTAFTLRQKRRSLLGMEPRYRPNSSDTTVVNIAEAKG